MANIVICGGGYSGVQTALELDRLTVGHSITLIDRSENHTLLPSLPEAIMNRGFYQIPYRAIFDKKRIRFLQSTILTIDMEKKQVVTEGCPVDYNFLVIAIGGAAHVPEIPGLESAYKFNDINDVQKIIRRLRTADNETVVVAGAGATGVEVAGEIATYAETAGKKLAIVLASPGLLAGFPENTRSWARSYLHALGIDLKIGPKYAVSKVSDGSILLHSGETIKSSFMMWTGGTKSSSLPSQIGLTTGYRDRAVVNQFLQSIDRQEVFVVGDCALILDEQGRQLPTSAQFAKQQGKLAAMNVNAAITRKDMEKYTPSQDGFAISIGPSFAVARIGTLDLYGGVASSAKKLIKLKYLKEIAGASTAARDYFS